MIKQARWMAALASAGLLAVASAQSLAQANAATLTQTVTNAFLVASEYFGDEARTVSTDGESATTAASPSEADQPMVVLTVGTSDIAADNEAELKFELSGATFASGAGLSNLSSGDENAAFGLISGGSKGDSVVTYRVTASGGAIGSTEALTFAVPNLDVTPAVIDAAGAKGVTVTSTVKVLNTAGATTSRFPSKVLVGTIDLDGDGTTSDAEKAASTVMNKRVIGTKGVVTAKLGEGETAEVSLANRKVLATGTAYNKMKALKLGALTVEFDATGTAATGDTTVQAGVFTLDGTRLAVANDRVDSSLSGDINITVSSSNFKSGDKVVLVAGLESTDLASSGNGTMTGEVDLEEIATPGTSILFVPGGVENLTPGTYDASAVVEFDNSKSSKKVGAKSTTGTLKYQGVSTEGYAYGVVKSGGTDTSFLRVTCADPKIGTDACSVFLDCNDKAGMGYFGELPSVARDATEAYSSEAIGTALDGGWTAGRGSCDVMSDGGLVVQHMVLSHGLLVNSTAVVGRDEATDAIQKKVDAICFSGDTPGGAPTCPSN